jgi:hypothetical protein
VVDVNPVFGDALLPSSRLPRAGSGERGAAPPIDGAARSPAFPAQRPPGQPGETPRRNELWSRHELVCRSPTGPRFWFSELRRLPAAMADSRNDLATRVAVDCCQERRRDKASDLVSGREQQARQDAHRVPAQDPKGPQNNNGNYPKPDGAFRPRVFIHNNHPTFNRVTSERSLPEAPCKKLESRRGPWRLRDGDVSTARRDNLVP